MKHLIIGGVAGGATAAARIRRVSESDVGVKTVPKYNNIHTAAQRKIAALRRVAGATAWQILLPCSITRLGIIFCLSSYF